MRNPLLLIFAGLFSLLISSTAEASIYSVDLDQSGDLSSESWNGPCYCGSTVTYSKVFDVHAGDIINFGSIQLFSFQAGPTPDGGPNQALVFIQASPIIAFDPTLTFVSDLRFDHSSVSFTLCAQNAVNCSGLGSSTISSLLVTVPDGATELSLAWVGPFIYSAPAAEIASVPEPSIWAMLLIGFTTLGFAARRRLTREFSSADLSLAWVNSKP